MKKHLVSIIAIAIIVLVFSEKSYSQMSLGFRTGAGFNNIVGKDMFSKELENKMAFGFNIGFNVEIPLAAGFYLQPGLLYAKKGSKINSIEGELIKGSQTLSLNYLELPVNFIFKPEVGAGRVILGFGPYLAYGISGTANNNYKIGLVEVKNKKDVIYKNEANLKDLAQAGVVYKKPLDVGANIIAGYEFSNGLSFQINAQYGLVNIRTANMLDKALNSNAKESNIGFGISLGYRL